MKKRIKHPRLPSGFGTIRYLGERRSRPYQVRAAASMDGDQVIPGEILAYVEDWYKGFALLTAYNAHTWHPGDDIEESLILEDEGLDGVVRRLLDDYRHISGKRFQIAKQTTFLNVCEAWYKDKYENPSKRTFSQATKDNIQKGVRRLEVLYDRPFAMLRLDDLQAAIDDIDAPTMQEAARTVLHGVYQYAIARDIVDRDYSMQLKLDAHVRKNGTPFTPKEIKTIWAHRDEPIPEMMLIMIYSGFRISAFADMKVDLKKRYFQGGIKTDAGKNRIVPIHPAIYPLVKKRLERYDGKFIPYEAVRTIGYGITKWCRAHGMSHTPHHTRHTFSMLCEKYEVKENDRKRLLGHHFKDVTNEVYGHRDLEDLRKEIEKIPICEKL